MLFLRKLNYLRSTEAPDDTNCPLISSASSTFTFSLITAGNLSTIAFAAINSFPVISLTNLIIATLLGPVSVNTILTSEGPAAADPSTGAAATAAAATTPKWSSIAFTNSFKSDNFISSNALIISSFDNAIIFSSSLRFFYKMFE
uniref:Conserved hypothetical transmembrane protein n=1 Tax=Spiroplasma citri TaxID=2133 RepID=Q14QN0_SPICI|nr:conserved hypothetical transmembrane protein [Spiroplasma citri]